MLFVTIEGEQWLGIIDAVHIVLKKKECGAERNF